MRKIYHILGANIPHHNQTILTFFAHQLKENISQEGAFAFWVVGKIEKELTLNMLLFKRQWDLVRKMILLARQDKSCHFFLHGQFNFFLWFAIIFRLLPVERLTWHIWGADLYENSHRMIFKLLYPLRRIAQKRLVSVAGTLGDLAYFQRLNSTAECELLYFPTKMDLSYRVNLTQENKKMTILVGNSGDPSNQHLQAFRQIRQKLGENVHLIVPMGYPKENQHYIFQVKQQAKQFFAESAVDILTENLTFDAYLEILAKCDIGCFLFERQQGIGTMCLLLQRNIPLLLNSKNPFIQDLNAHHIPFLLMNELDMQQVLEVKQKLTALDKTAIPFFAPNYLNGWVKIINKITQG